MADTASQLGPVNPEAAESSAGTGSLVLESGDPTAQIAKVAHAHQGSVEPPLAIAYIVQARLAKAVKQLRSSFEAAGLAIVLEMDISSRIRTSLGMDLAPCSILSVTCPSLLVQALVIDPAQLTLIPLHVVAIEKDHWTRIYLAHPARFDSDAFSAFRPKLRGLATRIQQCLGQVAARVPSAF